jgi:transcriptional regulator with XRE-family HTH domain
VTLAFGAAVRAERGYGQEAFATHAGMDRSYYGAIERGEFNVSLSTILKLAEGLEVPAHELLRRASLLLRPAPDTVVTNRTFQLLLYGHTRIKDVVERSECVPLGGFA